VSVASQKLAYLNDLVKEERKEAILERLRAIVYD
jgi:hypothetical protein